MSSSTRVPRLFRFAVRRLGNEDAAEDVVQAALIIAMRKIGSWRGEAALFTWLCTICRHELSAYWARTGRQPITLPLDDHPDTRAQIESLAHDGPGPCAELERHDLSDRVRVTLDHLPRPYGDVLTWKYRGSRWSKSLNGWVHGEGGRVHADARPGGVSRRLSHARGSTTTDDRRARRRGGPSGAIGRHGGPIAVDQLARVAQRSRRWSDDASPAK